MQREQKPKPEQRLTMPQRLVLQMLPRHVRGSEVVVARALEKLGLAVLADNGSLGRDGTNVDSERWYASLTLAGKIVLLGRHYHLLAMLAELDEGRAKKPRDLLDVAACDLLDVAVDLSATDLVLLADNCVSITDVGLAELDRLLGMTPEGREARAFAAIAHALCEPRTETAFDEIARALREPRTETE